MPRGDIIPIDPRSHLEVADCKHRYAKNLRLYFKEYHRLHGSNEIEEYQASVSGASTPSRKWIRYEPFFKWLDNADALPNLEDCPRSLLDEDKVEYLISDEERFPYEIDLDGREGDGLWRLACTGQLVNTGPKGWIFVLLNGRMYACEKRTSTFPRFHHSSFFAGAGVSAAGMVVCSAGRLTKLFPHSGHYRPHDRHLLSLLSCLRDKGVDLATVQVDVQRVLKLSRQAEKDGGVKMKKTDSALYMDGASAYSFLITKSRMQECGVLRQINKLRIRSSSAAGEETCAASRRGSLDYSSSGAGPADSDAAPCSSTRTPQRRRSSKAGAESDDSMEGPVLSAGRRALRSGSVDAVMVVSKPVNSPFCAPIFQSPPSLRQGAVSSSSGVLSTLDEEYPSVGLALRPHSTPSAAESRAKVLSSLLYFPADTSSSSNVRGGVEEEKLQAERILQTAQPLSGHPPGGRAGPAVQGQGQLASTSSGSAGNSARNVVPAVLTAPMKRVTSHTSISSSLGSNSYISQYLGGGLRSRSQSKVDDFECDLRALLADSPSLAPALTVADMFAQSTSAQQQPHLQHLHALALPVSAGPLATTLSSAGTSACPSRTRSRCSSFNPPTATSTVMTSTYSNSLPVTDAALMMRLQAAAAARESTTNSSEVSKLGGLERAFSQERSTRPVRSDSDSAAEADALVGPARLVLDWNTFTPSSSFGAPTAAARSEDEEQQRGYHCEGVGVLEGVAEEGADGEARARRCSSPTPSFTNSLSSCDSLPNNLMDLLDPTAGAATDDSDGAQDCDSGDNAEDPHSDQQEEQQEE